MSRGRDNCPLDCKVYVGELGNNATRHELEDAFGYYGPLRNVWVARNPPGFAFVMFEDPRDARDAARGLNGKMICGRRVRVELSTGKSRHTGRPEDRYSGAPRESRYSPRRASRSPRSPRSPPPRSPPPRPRSRERPPRREVYHHRESPPPREYYKNGGGRRYRSRSPGSVNSSA
ncbi:serine/arginine-rich splicing factor 3-like [Brevipalpus obovatus]|uniref:serine/arginine-rich splicing factor 3-like n=1 Tax=Brevipalpus obovatus TaxID=246614 RepID=UPI003D9DBBE8